MNSLSWLLYWADVLPSVATWLCLLSFILFLAGLAAIGIGFSMMADSDRITRRWDGEDYEMVAKPNLSLYQAGRMVRNIGFGLAPLFFILWGASFLVPEKETFYMIAGSEAGERALHTPEFDKVRKVINKYLDDKIDDGDTSSNTTKQQ